MRFVPGFLIGTCAAAATAAAVWFAAQRLATGDPEQNRWLERRLAESVAAGKDILFPAQVDEATLRWLTAERLKEAPQIAVFGSSHGLQVSSVFAAPYRVSNFCISGGSLPDHLVTTHVLSERRAKPRVALVFVDPWYFDIHLDFLMWRARPQQLAAMEDALASLSAGDFPRVFRERAASISKPKLRSNYSLEPLTHAVDEWIGSSVESIVETKPEDGLGTVLTSDGAIVPAGNRREIGEAEARALAIRQFAQNRDRHRYGIFSHVDEGLWKVFERWVQYLQQDSGKVVFILTPYHPAIYERAVHSPKNHLREIEERLRALAARMEAPVAGSYDPAHAKVGDKHFVDGDHLREEGLALVLGSVLPDTARAAGLPGEPAPRP